MRGLIPACSDGHSMRSDTAVQGWKLQPKPKQLAGAAAFRRTKRLTPSWHCFSKEISSTLIKRFRHSNRRDRKVSGGSQPLFYIPVRLSNSTSIASMTKLPKACTVCTALVFRVSTRKSRLSISLAAQVYCHILCRLTCKATVNEMLCSAVWARTAAFERLSQNCSNLILALLGHSSLPDRPDWAAC